MKLKKPSLVIGVIVALVALVGVALAVHIAHTTGGFGSPRHDRLIEEWVYDFVTMTTALVILARAVLRPEQRWSWMMIGIGTLLWGFSDLYYSFQLSELEEPPFPAPNDVTYVAGYIAILGGIAGLARGRVRRMAATEWADVAIATLAVAAIGASVLVGDVLTSYAGYPTLQIGTAVAYPILDLAILAVAVSAISLTGWRPGAALALLCVGITVVGVGDAVYTYQLLQDSYADGGLVNSTWVIGATVMMVAALVRPPASRAAGVSEGWRSFASPVIFSVVVLAFFVVSRQNSEAPLTGVLMGLTLVAIVVRLGLTFHENRRLVTQLKRDALTHLGNRNKLMLDLGRVFDEDAEPHTLTFLDLDGFKSYNDAFGHPAGDAVLTRLGAQLGEAVGGKGAAYRLGGDEFALLIEGDLAATTPVVAAASVALSERGEGFHITSSSGSAELPMEAHDPAVALQLADQRMYADKDSRRTSPGGEVEAVLVRILQQRAPELGAHGQAVAKLASAVAQHLGMTDAERKAVARAAELHDIGKMAIPDAILNKPGPLDHEEWDFMRQHTIVGERILGAASSLAAVGSIVRSSHERWDGAGYPDGLAGEEIPLASRIVFVCDAYDAMISRRPYTEAMPRADALAELRNCAGTMFDPRVVAAFCDSAPNLKAEVERTRSELAPAT